MLSTYGASQRERAAVAALQQLPKDLKAELRALGRDEFPPLLVRAAARLSPDPVLTRIIGSGRYSPYKDTPGVRFGGTRAVTRSGVPGRVLVRGLEFGSAGRRQVDYLQTRAGRQVPVRRRTTRQFMPDTSAVGRAIGPAAEAVSDEVLTLWLDKVEELLVRAFDEGA